LSFAQQRLWFLDQFEPGNIQYNIPISVRLKGDVDVKQLENVLNKIIERHETLRTTFDTMSDGRARQVIHPMLKIDLPLVDLSDYADNREELARQVADAEAAKPFDLTYGPLIRAKLIRLDAHEHVLIIVTHHIVSDGWSVSVVIREFAAVREALFHNQPVTLPPLTIQYADFAAWQRQWLSGSRLETELTYWKNQLESPPPALELPTDRSRSAASSHRGKDVIFNLSSELSDAITRITQKQGVTTFMTLMAAFQVLLARFANQTDILVGTPIANRTRKEVEPLIGFFVNTLVMRSDLSDNPSFHTLLERIKKTALDAYDNQNVPFEKLVDALQPERDTQHTPFFQVMFAMQDSALESIELSNLNLSVFQISSGSAKFDMSLSMVERFGTLRGQLEYDADLFDESTIQRFVHHFQILLHNLTSDPEVPVLQTAVLDDTDSQTIIKKFNEQHHALPDNICLPVLFEKQVAHTPDAIAVSDQHSELSFAELNIKANRCAAYLRAQGVGADQLVGVSTTRSVDAVAAILAVLKAGAGYVPLDPDYPRERLEFILADTGITHLLTQTSVVENLPISSQKVLLMDKADDILAEYDIDNPPPVSGPDNIAYIIYTSGSTGKPKGVMISHRSAYNLLVGLQNRIYNNLENRQIKASLNAPLLFDASVQQLVTLLRGNHLCIIPADVRTDGDALLHYVQEKKIDLLDCVPSQLKLLMSAGLFDNDGWIPKAILPGGEAIDESTWAKLQNCSSQIYNMYGPTECTVDATTCFVNQGPSKPTIGQPLTNAQIYILDVNQQPVPIGVTGEICISGDGLARGYWNRPDLTAEKFIPNPFGMNGERLYRTGDLGRFKPDGNIEFLGRLDHQVKLRGYRMELGEIEANLQEHENIKEAIVIVREDEPGDKRLVSYFKTSGSETPNAVELRDFLMPRLPDYMIPSYFVALDKFPLTPNGKIDRKALPKPQIERSDLASDYAEASTDAELVLVDVWKQVLGVEEIGIDDNFFELGGDSILSIQVIARAHQHGYKLSPKQIFDTPTIRGLAANAQAGVKVDAEQGIVAGDAPLTPIQHWFFEQNFENRHHWNQSVSLDVLEKLDTEALKHVVVKILEHHDALRLRFTQVNGAWSSHLVPTEENNVLHVFDLSQFSDDELISELEQRMKTLQAGHNLEQGPIFQIAYFDLGEHRTDKLFLTIHHTAIDGLSWRILLEDIVRAYDAAVHGRDIKLPAKTTSYKQWAEKLVDYAQSTTDLPKVWDTDSAAATLPVDVDSADDIESSTHVINVELSVSDTLALLQDIPAAYQTQINDVLLTALAMSFEHWNVPSIRVALEGHGREDVINGVEISRTVGWFTTLFPVTLNVAHDAHMSDKVETVKSQLRAIPNNGFDYGVLRYLKSDSDVSKKMSDLPEPQVAFNYLGQFNQIANDPRFRVSDMQSAAERHPAARRVHQIFISGKVAQDQLQMSFFYSDNLYKTETITALAENYIKNLQSLIFAAKGLDNSSYIQFGDDHSMHDDDLQDVLSELDFE
jgi:amino acid adenylation domain-containing protein/non-ribosomal peptide synthase protein (TIGR01720 family)